MLIENNGQVSPAFYKQKLVNNGLSDDEVTLRSVRRIFDLSFFIKTDRKKYGNNPVILLTEDSIYFHPNLMTSLRENEYFVECVMDVINVANSKNKKYAAHRPLTLYEKYSKKDICRLLNWDTDEKGTMFGYRTKYNTCPIFITYHKSDVEESIDYGDELLNPSIFRWYTRNNRTLESNEVKEIIHAEENDIDIHLFVKKDDDEGNDFYYLGTAVPKAETIEQTVMASKGKELPVVRMNLSLEQPIENTLYKYIKEA